MGRQKADVAPKRHIGRHKGKCGLMTNDIRSKVIECEQLGGAEGQMGCRKANGAPKGKWGLITNDIWSKASM
jgi:hypothetical protein